MAKVSTQVTFLEMTSYPGGQYHLTPPVSGVDVVRAKNPPVAFYRYLFEQVGRTWQWVSRKAMDDESLRKIVHDPKVEIFVLYVGGVPAGYIELDVRKPKNIEILFYGLMTEFLGKGLGTFLLNWTLAYVWNEKKPDRLWVHTCDLDSPKALGVYLKAGFKKYDEQTEVVDTSVWDE